LKKYRINTITCGAIFLTTVSTARIVCAMRMKIFTQHLVAAVLAIAVMSGSASETLAFAISPSCMCNQTTVVSSPNHMDVGSCPMAASQHRPPCNGTASGCLHCIGCATQISLFGATEFTSFKMPRDWVAAASMLIPPDLVTNPALPPPIVTT